MGQNIITVILSESLNSLGNQGLFGLSENLLTTKCKAKYAVSPDGELRILSVQEFSQPRFRPAGWEREANKCSLPTAFPEDLGEDIQMELDEKVKFENLLRSMRRAKIACFDIIQCNPDLDAFVTMTLSPDKVASRCEWSLVYSALRIWLSNRVQRSGLKYIAVPELHKDGKNIHFHAIMNSCALKLEKARYPDTGRLMKHKGQQVYNVSDFDLGFTTAKLIEGESATDKVAKYIFKYMGKQMGQKIGGRFYLHGGELRYPLCRYADSPEELIPFGMQPIYTKELEITSNLRYREQFFV